MNKSVNLFNQKVARLRISVTHNCQLNCSFCHQEGIEDHWSPIFIDIQFFKNLICAFKSFNGREINITGGEPLLHPKINDLINIAHSHNWKLALCTNGLLLEKVFEQIKNKKLDQIKVSLHSTDNIEGKKLLGEAWNFKKVERNIEKALKLGANITLNFTHTLENSIFFEEVIKRALEWNVDLSIIDLIPTRWQENISDIGYISGNISEKIILKYSKYQKTDISHTGCKIKIFLTPSGRIWKVKDFNFGRLFTSMCQGCHLKNRCGEGVFVLRVDSKGIFKPCLLRKDLEYKCNPNNLSDVKSSMKNMIKLMFSNEDYKSIWG